MTLNFTKTLPEALKKVNYQKYQHFVVHESQLPDNPDEVLEKYGDLKWKIVDLINENYAQRLKDKFDLYNWLNHHENDELAYFINEAGSNCLNYSDHKIPYKFHLWLGLNGFVVGIEQKGKGFNALDIYNKKLKENQGKAFDFFAQCKSEVFFDICREAKVVYFEFIL